MSSTKVRPRNVVTSGEICIFIIHMNHITVRSSHGLSPLRLWSYAYYVRVCACARARACARACVGAYMYVYVFMYLYAVDSESDLDLDCIIQTESLPNTAAMHKKSVRPKHRQKTRRVSMVPSHMVSVFC